MRKASMKGVPPCPNCKATYPIVQAFWEKGERIVCCTHCHISARLVAVNKEDYAEAMADQERQVKALGIPVRPFVPGALGVPE